MKDGRSASQPFCSSQEWRVPKVILPSAGFRPVKDGSVLDRRLPVPGGQLTAMTYAARENATQRVSGRTRDCTFEVPQVTLSSRTEASNPSITSTPVF